MARYGCVGSIVGIAALLGCGPASAPPSAVRPAAATFLAAQAAVLPVALTNPEITDPSRWAIPRVFRSPVSVVEDGPDTLQVVIEDAGVRLLLRRSTRDFYAVSSPGTPIFPAGTPTGARATDAPFIRLEAGILLEHLGVELDAGQRLPVHFYSRTMEIHGELPASAVRYSFPVGERAPKGAQAKVALPIAITGTPGGEPFVIMKSVPDMPTDELILSKVGPTQGDFVLVTFATHVEVESCFAGQQIEVRGWIAKDRVLATDYGLASGRTMLRHELELARDKGVAVPRGERLYDRPGGRIVGVVTGDGVHLEKIASAQHWTAVEVPHRLGRETLWIH